MKYLRQVLTFYQKAGKRKGELLTLHNMGAILDSKGDWDDAFECACQALAIAKELKSTKDEADQLITPALIHSKRGRKQQALEMILEAVPMSNQPGNEANYGAHMGSLAEVHRHLGHQDEALELNQKSLAIAKKAGNLQGELGRLHEIGWIYRAG